MLGLNLSRANIMDELCCNCGTVIGWWVKIKRKRAYLLPSDEVACSKKCINEYYNKDREYTLLKTKDIAEERIKNGN